MENLELGFSTTGLGMLVVFLGLVFLMYIMIALAGVSKFGGKKPGRKADPIKTDESALIPEELSHSVAAPAITTPDAFMKASHADEEIAAIAAVMAILTSEGLQGRVTAVRPVGAKLNSWGFAGRRDIMASRL